MAGKTVRRGAQVGFLAFILLPLLFGCSAELRKGLTQDEAEEMMSALREAGIEADRAPARGGRVRLNVPSDALVRAEDIAVEVEQRLAEEAEVDSVLLAPSLIPTPTEERSRQGVLIARNLAQTIRAMPGVTDARVNLELAPAPSRFRLPNEAPAPATASVLVTYADHPVDESQLVALVVGAVHNLPEEQVTVVQSHHVPAPAMTASDLAQVGPIQVSRATLPTLKAVLGVAFGLNIALAICLLYLLRRRTSTPLAA